MRTPLALSTPSPGSRLLVALAVGLVVRLLLAPFGAFRGDVHVMRVWALRLATHSPSEFYAAAHPKADHLPGDLWILFGLAHIIHLVSPPMETGLFLLLVKLVPAVFDLGISAMLYLIARRLADSTAGLRAATLFVLNPASVFLTSIWGQWDPVSTLFVFLALWLLVCGSGEWSFPVLIYAILIKPPFAALIPLFTLAFVLRSRRVFMRSLVAAGASLLVALAVLLPFSVGIPPIHAHWSLLERLQYAWNYRPWTTTSAFNLWATPLDPTMQPDREKFFLDLSYGTWGTGLFLAVLVSVLVLNWRRRTDTSLVWACLAITFSSFMLTTRGHERYLFPSLVFAALLAALQPRLIWLYAVLSLTFLGNLYYIYALFNPAPRPDFLYAANLFKHAIALLNTAALIYVLFLLPRILEPVNRRCALHHTEVSRPCPGAGGDTSGSADVLASWTR